MFLKRQVLVNFSDVLTTAPSGMVISKTNAARLHAGSIVAVELGVLVAVEVAVGVIVGVLLGVKVAV